MASSAQIALSGIGTNQQVLDIIGQNVANANTPGFHRREAILAARADGSVSGAGVEIKEIRRAINPLIETALVQNGSVVSQLGQQVDGLNQIQAIVSPSEGSVHDLLENFFNQAQQLSTQPGSLTQRRVVLSAAQTLVDSLNSTSAQLKQVRDDISAQGKLQVQQINSLTGQIGELNINIANAKNTGGDANSLQDQRDLLVSQLAELVDVRAVSQNDGSVNLFSGGVPLLLSSQPINLVWQDGADQSQIIPANSDQPLTITGGKLGGLLQLQNQVLPELTDTYQTFENQLVQSLDEIHAKGLGMSGPMTNITSQRIVKQTNVTLDNADTAFPIQAGTLTVGMTDLSNGKRILYNLAIDPATQSLQSLATALSNIPNLQGVVDPSVGSLAIISKPGFAFDFAGGVGNAPAASSVTGSSSLNIQGNYTGTTNGTWTVTALSTGSVGQTSPLNVEVRNQDGTLLATVNVGLGYSPGSSFDAIQGVKFQIAAGTLQAGDSFTIPVSGDSDSAHVLGALGLNSFFSGNPKDGMALRADLLDHPENFALGTTGQASDTTNLVRMVNLRDQAVLSGNKQTFRQYLEDLSGQIGTQTQNAQDRQSAAEALQQQLSQQQQNSSGVDPNEELIKMVQFQRAFQLSSRFLSVVNATLDDLFKLVA